jgi:rubrerythrin
MMIKMARFHCNSCNYDFEGGEKLPKKCPYCGKASVRRERSAEDIVKEVEAFMNQ